MKPCKVKLRFDNYEEALLSATSYMTDIPLTFTFMVPYYCERHGCYHIGHNQTKRKYELSLLYDLTDTSSSIRSASNEKEF